MTARLEQMLQFCSFYNTNRVTLNLSLMPLSEAQTSTKKPKSSTIKKSKKKFEQVASKSRHNQKRSIVKKLDFCGFQQSREQMLKNQVNDKYDLQYYLKHIAGSVDTKYRVNEQGIGTSSSKKYKEAHNLNTRNTQQYLLNYDTFGCSGKSTPTPVQYLSFAEKVKRSRANSNREHPTERPVMHNSIQQFEMYPKQWQHNNAPSRMNIGQEGKSQLNKKKMMNSFLNYEQKRQKLSNEIYQPRKYDQPQQSNLLYSPVRRESKITNSSVYDNLNVSPEREWSRSKSRSKKKHTGERPFYDTSRLTRQLTQFNRITSKSNLHKTEFQIEEDHFNMQLAEHNNNKIDADDYQKRETDVTVKHNYHPYHANKVVSKMKNDKIQMDDACESYLRLAIQNNKALSPIRVKSKIVQQ